MSRTGKCLCAHILNALLTIMRNQLSQHDLRRLAVEAEVDPRTATRWLAGLSVASATRARLQVAATKLGVVPASRLAGAA